MSISFAENFSLAAISPAVRAPVMWWIRPRFPPTFGFFSTASSPQNPGEFLKYPAFFSFETIAVAFASTSGFVRTAALSSLLMLWRMSVTTASFRSALESFFAIS